MAANRKPETVELPAGVQMSKAERSKIEARRQMLIDVVEDFQRAGHSAMAVGVVHGATLTTMRIPDNATGLGLLLGLVKTLSNMAERHNDKFTVGVLEGIETALTESFAFLEARRGDRSIQ